MTEEELRHAFDEFNFRYFDGALSCDVVLTEDWMDDGGNYCAESIVEPAGDGFLTGIANGVKVQRATALYTHSKNLIRIPRWKTIGRSAAGVLLHEMAHSAANEPEVEHGPKWHAEMKRLLEQGAPINLQDVTPGHTDHELVGKYGVGSAFWESL